MNDRRRLAGVPPNVAVFLGLSTGAYALGLAAVTGLQAQAEAQLRADRAPVVGAVDALASGHDALAERLAAASRAYEAAAAAYRAAGSGVGDLDARLGALAAAVSDVSGSAASLPTSVKLPAVSAPKVNPGTPVTHATTGASGG